MKKTEKEGFRNKRRENAYSLLNECFAGGASSYSRCPKKGKARRQMS
jgi:hypothetical protein